MESGNECVTNLSAVSSSQQLHCSQDDHAKSPSCEETKNENTDENVDITNSKASKELKRKQRREQQEQYWKKRKVLDRERRKKKKEEGTYNYSGSYEGMILRFLCNPESKETSQTTQKT